MAATPPKSIPRQVRAQIELIPADDDLFPEPPAAAPDPFTRTRCYVCERGYVAVDAPARLCPLCLEALEATRTLVIGCIDAVLVRMDVARNAWDARCAGNEGWQRVAAAMARIGNGVTQAQFDAQWAKRKAEGGELGALLSAYEAFAVVIDQAAAELQRWHRAQAEVNAAWMATDV